MTNSIYDKYNSNPLTTPATTDLIPVVDVSDTTESSDGTTKGMQLAKIQGLITAATTGASGQVQLSTLAENLTGTDTGKVPAVDVLLALMQTYWINILHGNGITGSGTETSAISTFLNGLSDGSTVLVPSGTTLTHDTVTITSKNDITLIGWGASLVDGVSSGGSSTFKFDLCTKIRIFGFDLDRKNSEDATYTQNGFEFDGCDDCVVNGAHFTDVFDGVRTNLSGATRCTNITVTNCIGRDATVDEGDDPTTEKDASEWLVNAQYTDGLIISNNQCYNQLICLVIESTGASIEGNVSRYGNTSVIYITKNTSDFTISGNTILYNGKDSIKCLKGANNGTISGNTLHGAGKVTINSAHHILIQQDGASENPCHDIQVIGNKIRIEDDSTRNPGGPTSSFGISLEGYNLSVVGNTIICEDPAANDSGIRVRDNSGDEDTYDILIEGNHINNIINPIRIHNTNNTISRVTVRGNSINGTSNADCVYVQCVNNAIDGVLIEDNVLRNYSSFCIGLVGAGISDFRVVNNSCYDSDGSSSVIYANATATGTIVVKGNTSDGSESAYFDITDDTYFAIMDNYTTTATDSTVVRYTYSTGDTATYNIEAYMSGSIIDNAGNTQSCTATLPVAVPGLKYTVRREASFAIILDPDGTDSFLYTSGFAAGIPGDYIQFDTDDCYMHIECHEAGVWTQFMIAGPGGVGGEDFTDET